MPNSMPSVMPTTSCCHAPLKTRESRCCTALALLERIDLAEHHQQTLAMYPQAPCPQNTRPALTTSVHGGACPDPRAPTPGSFPLPCTSPNCQGHQGKVGLAGGVREGYGLLLHRSAPSASPAGRILLFGAYPPPRLHPLLRAGSKFLEAIPPSHLLHGFTAPTAPQGKRGSGCSLCGKGQRWVGGRPAPRAL
jgi:hypothetical protein